MPAVMEAQACPPLTSTGILRGKELAEPLPSSPKTLSPQQYPSLAVVTPQACMLPAAIEVHDPEVERVAATVTLAVALADPDVAVIVAWPFATDVTRPVDEIVVTKLFDVNHDIVAPAIVCPF